MNTKRMAVRAASVAYKVCTVAKLRTLHPFRYFLKKNYLCYLFFGIIQIYVYCIKVIYAQLRFLWSRCHAFQCFRPDFLFYNFSIKNEKCLGIRRLVIGIPTDRFLMTHNGFQFLVTERIKMDFDQIILIFGNAPSSISFFFFSSRVLVFFFFFSLSVQGRGRKLAGPEG